MSSNRDTRRLLRDLALDLHWAWSHRGDALWRALDPEVWSRTGNPFVLIAELDDAVLARLEQDPSILRLIDDLVADQVRYRHEPTWWSTQAPGALRGVAYFSMEFGIAESLPIYAGGLGVLAGDALKGASDLGLPVTGIGLLFRQGYFRQRLDADGRQHAVHAAIEPARLPLVLARDANGEELHVSVALPGRAVRLRAWRAQVGRVDLYLLDSNDPRNAPADQGITNILYGGDAEQRLVQEIVLGVGGWRLVEALGLPVQVCHLNEGHAALAAVERTRQAMLRHGLSFAEALWATRAGNVFTTHTPLAAAFDHFPHEMVLRYGREYARSMGVGEDAMLVLGHDPRSHGVDFNMAFLAARCSGSVQAVSRRHAEVSRMIFSPLFPRRPLDEIPIGHVTNGVHMASWDSPGADTLWSQYCGSERWRGDVGDHACRMAAVPDNALWAMRLSARQQLVQFARSRLVQQLEQRGGTPAEVAMAAIALDPNALTLGFARRFTEYKRPNLLMWHPERLVRLLGDPRRPVQLILAGKAHPDDQPGQRFIREWIAFARDARVRGKVVFLEDYDLSVAEQMVQGIDVWVNTPRAPWEACGTSGMKVLVNGGLNLSILDGWWAEAFDPEVGWGIASRSDDEDAERLLDTLEQEVVPLFFEHDHDGVPGRWVARVRASLARLTPQFSTNRMLSEYVERLYKPAAEGFLARSADHGARARALAAWSERLERAWPAVRLGDVGWSTAPTGRTCTVEVHLGELTPDDVDVQLYAEAGVAGSAPFRGSMRLVHALSGAIGVYRYDIDEIVDGRSTDYTPRVIPRLPDAALPNETRLIRWP